LKSEGDQAQKSVNSNLAAPGTGGSAEVGRRMSRALPMPLRLGLRSLADWVEERRPPAAIENWSTPLVPTKSGFTSSGDLLGGARSTGAGIGVVEPTRSGRAVRTDADETSALRCLVVTALLDVGGMDEVVALLARRLPEHGVRTAVLHVTADPSSNGEPTGRLGRMLKASGIDVYETDETGALEWIKRWRPDVITAHGAPDWMVEIAQQAGVPYVDNLHGMHNHFWANWSDEAKRASKISAIVSVSELIRQQYLAGNPHFPAHRLVTIPNGVDGERRVSGDRDAIRARLGLTNEFVFVSLARHCQQKNSYGLIAAFAKLAQHRPEIHLVIAGKPDQPRYYRETLRLRAQLPCRDRIHLRDHAASPAQLLAASDGFVLDSFFEGWSLASMEALFAGVPVVLSDVGGAREQIGNHVDRGYLVPNPLGDPLAVNWESLAAARFQPQVNQDELVTAMDQLARDREHYAANRERLAAESATRFSAVACLERHAAVLKAVGRGAELPVDSAE
jgi:glycosyltransferase involved in cell wall biosynthesis